MKKDEYKGHALSNCLSFYDYFTEIAGEEYLEFLDKFSKNPTKMMRKFVTYSYVALRKAAEPSLADRPWKEIRDSELDVADLVNEELYLKITELLTEKKADQLQGIAQKAQKGQN